MYKKKGDVVAKIKKGVVSMEQQQQQQRCRKDDASPQGVDGVSAGAGFTLNKCDFEIKRGELVCVVGAVGSRRPPSSGASAIWFLNTA